MRQSLNAAIDSARRRFFSVVSDTARTSMRPTLLIITHFLSDRPDFLRALHTVGDIAAIVPIPYSIERWVLETVGQEFPVHQLDLNAMLDGARLLALAESLSPTAQKPLAIVEIGGYFAKLGGPLKQRLGDRFLGVVEDTESGHRRYEAENLSFPVVSVARSRLKLIEDRLIGPSVAFSLERLLRSVGRILTGQCVGVLGYGRIGSSITKALAGRGPRIAVYDTSARQRALAVADGFASPDRDVLLGFVDVVIGATGAQSMTRDDFRKMKDGVFLASASSKRVEFDLDGLNSVAVDKRSIHPGIDQIVIRDGKTLHLLGGGEPINFLDGAVVGPAIALVQAEQFLALRTLISNATRTELLEVPAAHQDALAKAWLSHFVDVTKTGELLQPDGPAA